MMKQTVFSNARWSQLLAPLEILMNKISLKYYIFQFKFILQFSTPG